MAKRTQKAKSVGRFGARYGVRIRRRIRQIEERQKANHPCPQCGAERVRREGTGIWKCRKCEYTFAGGAYQPHTPAFRSTERTLREIAEEQKSQTGDTDVEAAIAPAETPLETAEEEEE